MDDLLELQTACRVIAGCEALVDVTLRGPVVRIELRWPDRSRLERDVPIR